MHDFTLLVPTFNKNLTEIFITLTSILLQKDIDLEIIVTDDHSSVDQSSELKNFFEAFEFDHYRINILKENQGTTRNCLSGLSLANGRFLKILPPGDMLYDASTLTHVREFCLDNEVKLGFGKVVAFTTNGDSIRTQEFDAPKNADEYLPDSNTSSRALFLHQLNHSDWIPGISQFGSTSFICNQLERLIDDYGVVFCEDFMATLSLASGIKPLYYDRNICWYEYGSGVSTSRNMDFVKRLYQDHVNIYGKIEDDNIHGDDLSKAKFLFNLRKLATTNAAVYSVLHKIRSAGYMKSDSMANVDSEKSVNSFFEICRSAWI